MILQFLLSAAGLVRISLSSVNLHLKPIMVFGLLLTRITPNYLDRLIEANSVDPGQTASKLSKWEGDC